MSSYGSQTPRPERPIGGEVVSSQPMVAAVVGRCGEGVSGRCCGAAASVAAWS